MQKKCPLNCFEPCIGEACGMSIVNGEGRSICSLQFIGHELFVMADLALLSTAASDNSALRTQPGVKKQEDKA